MLETQKVASARVPVLLQHDVVCDNVLPTQFTLRHWCLWQSMVAAEFCAELVRSACNAQLIMQHMRVCGKLDVGAGWKEASPVVVVSFSTSCLAPWEFPGARLCLCPVSSDTGK